MIQRTTHLSILVIVILLLMAFPMSAVADAHCVDGGPDDNVLIGGFGDECLRGMGGNDYVSGGLGDDLVAGGRGHDTVDGGLSDDDVRGGTGADHVYDGPGDDVLWGSGPVLQDDGAPDVVDGGTGYDICFVDSMDIVKNCEDVRY